MLYEENVIINLQKAVEVSRILSNGKQLESSGSSCIRIPKAKRLIGEKSYQIIAVIHL